MPAFAINPPSPGLSHDDFRRAHDNFRGVHHHCRRPDDDIVMMFVSCVPATPAVGYKASSGGEKRGDAD
jgi:hypothetical protein